MADTVATKTLYDNNRNRRVVKFTSISDGTGESAVVKVDISTLPGVPTAVKINRFWWCCDGMKVRLLYDHATDEHIATLALNGFFDLEKYGGDQDVAVASEAGDILFTTVGHGSGDTYTIILDLTWGRIT